MSEPTKRERQIEQAMSRVPCVACGNPDSPLGEHDCRESYLPEQLRGEALCDEIGHQYIVGDDRCFFCGEPYGESPESSLDLLAKWPVSSGGVIRGATPEEIVGRVISRAGLDAVRGKLRP